MKRWPVVALILLALAAALILISRNFGRRLDRPAPGAQPGLPQIPPPAATTGRAVSTGPAGPATPFSAAATSRVGASGQPTGSPAGPPRKRAWDPQFLPGLRSAAEGDPIRFELVGGEWAEGAIRHLEHRDGEVIYVAGQLTVPETGRFFFQKQTMPGNAGDFVGVVELPRSQRAFRIEPTGANGASELVARGLKEVICLNLPLPANDLTNDVENIPPLNPSTFPANLPIPPYQNGVILLQSLPGASAVLYLDYQGGYTPTWGGITYARPTISNSQIFDVWKRVTERYMAFKINVTTDLRVFQNAPPISRQRCIITPTSTAAPGAGGVSFVGSFQWGGNPDTPDWVFLITGKSSAEAIAHECGHALGLSHDGQEIGGTNHVEYYGGQGSGATGWAPIMGVAYYQPVAQWSKGEYQWANNMQDDLAIISANNNVGHRLDDTGATLASSRYLEVYPGNSAGAEGVIESTGDTDAFQFTTSGGLVGLTARPVGDWGDAAIQATLADADDTIIASNNPQSVLTASISTNLPAGTYTFRVTGAGRNNPFTNGFSPYASLGYYSITGSVANARLPSRFAIPENTPNGTLVGVVPANNPNGDPLTYTITSGNTGNTFAIDNSGNLSVAVNTLLDYEALARNTQLTVQFQMFVDIVDTLNPALTETNRRVLVAITNVNEPPTLNGFSSSVLEHTLPGTVIGTVIGTDPDFYTLLSYSIVGGNSNGMFTIDNQSGAVLVAGDLSVALQSVYNLTVLVSDQTPPAPLTATSTVTVTVLPNNSPYRPGSISYAVYTNLSGPLISSLTSAPSFPYDPALEKQVALFEGDSNRGDNYGAVMRGYLIPPATGSYTFWIATDDNGELWLSSSTNTAAIARIAYITGTTAFAAPRQWTKYPSQQSAPVSLVAGQPYYIEARLKEATGNDNIAVAWQCASAGIAQDVIPGRFLAPYFINYVPHAGGFVTSLHRDAISASHVGMVTVTDVNTNDDHTFAIVTGNTGGIFSLDPDSGILRVASELALQATAQTTFNLSVRVTDNGSPPRSGTATATVKIVAPDAITATSIRQEIWTNIGNSTAVSALTTVAKYPKRPDTLRALTAFDSGNQNLGDNYGSRIRAYLTPATSGAYVFYVASDDNSQLKFSVGTNPATATVIASVPGATAYQAWTTYGSQQSAPISLTAGAHYYIETLHKEGGGSDHVEVAWTGPGISGTNIIAGSFLTSVDLNYAPDLAGRTIAVPVTASNGALLATLTATDSPLDLIAYKIISGNTNNTFAIDPDTGRLIIADNALIVGQLDSGFTLQVQAQDSGYHDLYPRRSTNVAVNVQLVEAPALTWSGNGTNDNWSQGANWNGAAPAVSSPLIFLGANRQTNINDLLTIIGPVAIGNGGFLLMGNPLTLRAGLASTGDNTWAIDSTLNKPEAITSTSGTLTFAGSVDNGGNLLTLSANSTIQVDGIIAGMGGLMKNGPANVVLTAANTFAGPTTVAAGTLVLLGNGSIGNSSQVDVTAGATLDASALAGGLTILRGQTLTGSGAVRGNVIVSGTLAPGDSIGALSFSDALTLAGTLLVEINKTTPALTNDLVVVAGPLTLGGALVVINTDSALADGDKFKLFDAPSFSGSFASQSLPPPGAGLVWNTTLLAVDGTLRVEAPPAPLIQPVSLNGGNLTVQFQSATDVIYVLQAATNLVAPVAWANLSTNAGNGGLLTIPVPVDISQPQRFYRMMAQ